ncbi:MAG: shikimate kinase, partial [Myxococcota bacterium]
REILANRPTIWLNATIDVLAARVTGSDRPSLTGHDPALELAGILEHRWKLYSECAGVHVDTSRRLPEQTAGEVVMQWSTWCTTRLGGLR